MWLINDALAIFDEHTLASFSECIETLKMFSTNLVPRTKTIRNQTFPGLNPPVGFWGERGG